MKQKFSLLVVFLLSFSGCSLIPQNNIQEDMSNAASEYCEQNSWILEIVPDEWWSRWKCNFDDGSFCEERAYFHWECSPGWWDWNTIELEEIQDMQNDDTLSEDEKEELSELVEEIQEYDEQKNWWNDENLVQEMLEKFVTDWTGLSESDIDLMNEIMGTVIEG